MSVMEDWVLTWGLNLVDSYSDRICTSIAYGEDCISKDGVEDGEAAWVFRRKLLLIFLVTKRTEKYCRVFLDR